LVLIVLAHAESAAEYNAFISAAFVIHFTFCQAESIAFCYPFAQVETIRFSNNFRIVGTIAESIVPVAH
jgi:hypothetical protein